MTKLHLKMSPGKVVAILSWPLCVKSPPYHVLAAVDLLIEVSVLFLQVSVGIPHCLQLLQ